MPFALRIEGDLDITAFNQAFTTIIERHEVLRSNFREEGGLPYVTVRPAQAWKFASVDLSHQPLDDNYRVLPSLVHEACEGRFDIANDLLIRGQHVLLGVDANGVYHHAILGAIHHMVSDGWSLNLITHELAALYKAYREKSAALLAPLPIQYIDFAR
jgi:arthrofactin-type cyclic lipopeptide synthetase C